MGCACSKASHKEPIPSSTTGGSKTGLSIELISADDLPITDWFGYCDAYVIVQAIDVQGNPWERIETEHERLLAETRSSVHGPSTNPRWNQVLWLPADLTKWDIKTTFVRFTVMDKDYFKADDYIGTATVPLEVLLHRPVQELLVLSRDQNAVVAPGKPPKPTVLNIGVQLNNLPPSWPRPHPAVVRPKQYAKHILIMSRGTRGDVQPFVALARGMAEQNNWLVTFATELRWREFVLAKTQGLRAGCIRFRETGGDTTYRIEEWMVRQFMESKHEMIQCMMMAWSEADFFASGPVLVHIAEQLQASPTPVDLLVHSFTLTGLAMLVSERCAIPMAGFILQPSCIPSTDPDWKCVSSIDGGYGSLRIHLGHQLGHHFTTHETLQQIKTFAESNPFSAYSLPALRKDFGLPPAETWKTIQALNLPCVIPMMPSTFKRPSDWPSRTILTDFIFLREKKKAGEEHVDPPLPKEIQDFIDASREKGRKLVLMTFSSMPVSRRKMLKCAVKMLDGGKVPHSLIYVGKRFTDSIPSALQEATDRLTKEQRLLEVSGADFGVLFKRIDAFIVHGGLGTTVEALRMKKPVCVTGILLMDQRFWGTVCHEKGVGPPPVHIDDFHNTCVDFVDTALAEDSAWRQTAETLNWGADDSDGVDVNVAAFKRLLEEGIEPADSRIGTIGSRKNKQKTLASASPRRVSTVTLEMIHEAEVTGGDPRQVELLQQLLSMQQRAASIAAELEQNERAHFELERQQMELDLERRSAEAELHSYNTLPEAETQS